MSEDEDIDTALISAINAIKSCGTPDRVYLRANHFKKLLISEKGWTEEQAEEYINNLPTEEDDEPKR